MAVKNNFFRNSKEVEYLEAAFKEADKNRDGKVDFNEYVAILKSRGLEIDREQIESLFKLADR